MLTRRLRGCVLCVQMTEKLLGHILKSFSEREGDKAAAEDTGAGRGKVKGMAGDVSEKDKVAWLVFGCQFINRVRVRSFTLLRRVNRGLCVCVCVCVVWSLPSCVSWAVFLLLSRPSG